MNIYILLSTIMYSGYGENVEKVYEYKKDAIKYLRENGYRYFKPERLWINDSIYVRIEKHKLITKL
jgi:hypothetical protein